MSNHGLPPELEREIVGCVPLGAEGTLERTRVYVRGYHPELAMNGENMQILPETETGSHNIETVVDVTNYPPDYYLP